MFDQAALERLHEEACRAVAETREAMRAMAQRNQLPPILMSVCTLIDRVELHVSDTQGEASFELNEDAGTITFNARILLRVLEKADELADEVGYGNNSERKRVSQLALNLFILHEILHISQNFPNFASVVFIKAGLSPLGLPLLDVAADTAAAWVTAHVECERTKESGENDVLRHYVNMLVLAYVIGAFVFNATDKQEKIQRALGLITSAVLVQAQANGKLVKDNINAAWKPITPLIVLDLEATHAFNAVVIDTLPGMLISKYETSQTALVTDLWNSVGRAPISKTLELAARVLMRMGAISSDQEADIIPARRAAPST